MPKNWSDGDTLTSAGLNELTQSVNLRFPSAAVRDSTLVGPIAPVPGMRCTTASDNLTWVYIVVNSVGYWAPQRGTVCFNNYAPSAVGNSSQSGVVTGLTASQVARNLGNWFNGTTGVFNPKAPGYYEFSGAISFNDGQNTFNYFRLNTSTKFGGTTIAGSASVQWCVPTIRSQQYLNGTTDQVDMYSGGLLGTLATAGWQASFAAKYMGI